MKRNRNVFFILMVFILFSLTLLFFSENVNFKAYAQSSVKKKETGIVPKVADPTIMGWWKEDKSRVYTLKDGFNTYIYSKVYSYDPDKKIESDYGFFRVITFNRLVFAVETQSPYVFGNEPPMKIVKDGVVHLVVLYHYVPAWKYMISVFNEMGYLFNTISLGSKKPIFEDLNGDGNFETMVEGYIGSQNEPSGEYWSMEGKVLAIYRYMKSGSYFEQVKGREFEKHFLEHARDLIEKKYPKWLEKGRASSFDIQSRRQLYRIIEGWLATVESTQNVELIKEDLGRLRNLPWPSEEEKQKILEKVIKRGYPGLRIQ